MPIANAWICRGCWKPNKQSAAHCFQCKLPRDADAARIQQHAAVAAGQAAVPDPVPDIILTLPVVIFRYYGKALIGLALLLFVAVLLDALSGAADSYIFSGAVVVGACLAVGLLFRALAGAMHDRNPWVYLVAFLAASAFAALAMYQLFVLPVPLGAIPPQAATIRTWVTLIISGSAAICAALGLALVVAREKAD